MNKTLTPRQHELLGFLRSYHASNGRMPILSEIGARMGLTSSASATRYLVELEKKGAIKRVPGKRRGIVILRPVGTNA